ncbi:glycine cleavage system protein H [Blattabacterium cuenoti]|uniref:glycine cleavage system protein H n=1 Tax=Blattabacterium cuenoti TaxID=1653831 RepID=UPI00163C1D8E|nr:glycine cleavage system H protein [Blattabacterium cuenoti]
MKPNDLKFSKNHEWVGLEKQKTSTNNEIFAYVGITFFAQKELGDIIYFDIDSSILKQEKKKGYSFGTVEAVKTVSDLFMPVTGFVIEINQSLISKPELINQNPYNSWMIKIKISKISEYDNLLSFDEYKKYINY